jgi:hypothetical protein
MGASIVKVYGANSTWTVPPGTSVAGAGQTITKVAEANRRHVVTAVEVVTRGAAVSADTSVELKDGATVKWRTYFGVGALRGERVGGVFANPIEMSINSAVALVVGAAGAAVITEANMAGKTELA